MLLPYVFVIEEFVSTEDDGEINELSRETGLSMENALNKVNEFAKQHPNGSLIHSDGYLVEYEVDGAELACWIGWDFDD